MFKPSPLAARIPKGISIIKLLSHQQVGKSLMLSKELLHQSIVQQSLVLHLDYLGLRLNLLQR
jgi:hypothetical protein